MPVKFRELEKMLSKDGWKLDRITGSHHIYSHPMKKGTVTVPFHGRNNEIAPSVLKSGGMVIMAKFTAMVEPAGDGSWTASVLGEHTVLGTGDTKEEAVEDLRNGIQGLLEYLKEKGLPLPTQAAEYLTLEVAA